MTAAPGEPDGRRAGVTRHSGRRAGGSGTAEAILAAAREQFGQHGYDRATIRGIAAGAGVDPALVHHFYGTKEALFAAAMRLPVTPGPLLTAALAEAGPPGESRGEHLVRVALALWETPDVRATMLALVRSAVTGEQAAAMLREFITAAILRQVASAAGLDTLPADEAEYRIGLVATQMLGLAMARYVIGLPAVVTASADDLAAAVGPVLDRYLAGAIPVPGRPAAGAGAGP
jgi:AcrR family transcriptional regulator